MRSTKIGEEQENTVDADELAEMGHVWRISAGVLERAVWKLSSEIPEPVKLIVNSDDTSPEEFVEWLTGVLEDGDIDERTVSESRPL